MALAEEMVREDRDILRLLAKRHSRTASSRSDLMRTSHWSFMFDSSPNLMELRDCTTQPFQHQRSRERLINDRVAKTIPGSLPQTMRSASHATIPPATATSGLPGVRARLFSRLDGHNYRFDGHDAITIVLALAAGALAEDKLADWFRDQLSQN
jgi:hypothetical protein